MKRVMIFVGVAVLLVLGLAYAAFEISKARTFQFFGGLTARVATEQKVVALTFDDGPTPYSTEVIDILKKHNAKATVYVVGQNIERYPQEAKALSQAGIALGNHSYSHQRFYFKSQGFIDEEIQKTNRLIRDLGYKGEITFRPPNGKKLIGLPYYLNQHNIQTIMWDVEPDTYVNQQSKDKEQTDFIVKYTLENTKPGSIILLHPFCETCSAERKAIGPIIEGLKAKGYTFVTVEELLSIQK